MIDLWIALGFISIPLFIGGTYRCIHDKLSGGIMVFLSIALMAFSITMLIVTIPNTTPSALDVYRGKTTLEITYRDSVAVDSVVVYKMK